MKIVPNDYKEVIYGDYCKKCVYEKKEEHEEPCDECLSNPVNLWTHKPTKYKEKEKG